VNIQQVPSDMALLFEKSIFRGFMIWFQNLLVITVLWASFFKLALQTVEAELLQVRESNQHQKKRVVDMMTNLMKDLADIGTTIGSEFKVIQTCCFILPPHISIELFCT